VPFPVEVVSMVSSSQQFERIRKRKATTNGKRNKRERRALGTPKFAIHPEGYDPKAADARPAAKAAK
jgi:DNA invertase Pin-like site-specific DNA recombinase